MLDFTSKVLTLFKADTSDMKAGLKELQGEEKKLAQTQLDAANQRNAGYDSWIDKMGKANQALELVTKAVTVGREAFNAYADDLRLRAAAGAVSIDKLRAASLGLRTEHELLTFAAQTQHGAFKLTEEQMITAQRAMVALTRAGFEQEEVVKKVTEALVKANGGGLDDFGINLKSNGSDLENFNELMDALAKKAAGVDASTGTAAEGVQRMGVTMSDAVDQMKKSLGELVAALTPLLNALAQAVGLIARAAGGVLQGNDPMAAAKQALATQKRIMDAIAGGGTNEQMMARFAASGGTASGPAGTWGSGAGTFDEGTAATFLQRYGFGAPAKRGPRGRGDVGNLVGIGGYDQVGAPIGFGSTIYGSAAGIGGADGFDLMAPLLEKQKALTADWQTRLAAQQGKKTSFLESTFGKVEEFNAYGKAFDLLTGSVSAGLTAWIDGSMSAGQAMKKFIGEALKGLASQMLVESLKHGAYAIGSLAFGDVRGAGQHAAAAAAFGAGALAAGVAAKQLGGGGATTAASSGASAGSGAGGDSRDHRGSGGSGGLASQRESIVVVYTDPFATGSGRTKRHEASKVIGRALGRGESWREG